MEPEVEIEMARQRETKNFIVFEHKDSRQCVYVEKSTVTGTTLAEAESVIVTVRGKD